MDDESMPERPLRDGTITKLVVQKKNMNRVSVYLDGTFAFGIYQDLILPFDLRQGRALSVGEQQQIVQADRVLVAKAKAIDYLAHKPRTEQEVRRKLQQKGVDDMVIEEVIERLYELGYLDDAAYAKDYARGRFESGGYGPRRIRHDLQRRGVARQHIEAAVQDVVDPEEALATAHDQARKRLRRLQREADLLKRRKKLFDFLLRRGFSYDTVRRVVEETAEREGWHDVGSG